METKGTEMSWSAWGLLSGDSYLGVSRCRAIRDLGKKWGSCFVGRIWFSFLAFFFFFLIFPAGLGREGHLALFKFSSAFPCFSAVWREGALAVCEIFLYFVSLGREVYFHPILRLSSPAWLFCLPEADTQTVFPCSLTPFKLLLKSLLN